MRKEIFIKGISIWKIGRGIKRKHGMPHAIYNRTSFDFRLRKGMTLNLFLNEEDEENLHPRIVTCSIKREVAFYNDGTID